MSDTVAGPRNSAAIARGAVALFVLAVAGCAPRMTMKTPAPEESATPVVADSSTRPYTTLRVGIPRGARRNLVVPCRPVAIRESSTEWGDTLLVRAFADAADEEIAFERGEIDVAVFWPGELSAHLRADARGRDALLGRRSAGVLAADETTGGAPETTSTARLDPRYREMNAQLFGGDLVAWAADSAATPENPARRARFVDAALPGRGFIERWLQRSPARSTAPVVSRLVYLDVAIASADSLAPEWRARGVHPIYGIGCPVLVAPAHRGAVEQIGPDRFADLAGCEPTGASR